MVLEALLTLREVNPYSSRGDTSMPDVDASQKRWLTINDVDFTTPDILDCQTETGRICRSTSSIPFGPTHGGFVNSRWATDTPASNGTARERLHVLGLDMRTEAMVYSRATKDVVQYFLYHNGNKRLLGEFGSDQTETIPIWTASRYGYTLSGDNDFIRRGYYDEVTQRLESSPPIRNPRLGQYEIYPGNLLAAEVAIIPPRFGLAVAPNNGVVVSMELPDGTTVNYHSAAPDKRVDSLVAKDLSGKTVIPLTVR